MALNHISTAAMLALTHHWTTTARPVFDRPILREMPDLLDALGAQLVTLNQALDGVDPEAQIAKMTAQTKALDREHDDLLGRIYSYLTAAAELYGPDQPADASAAVELRDRLFPQGLAMKQASFQGQGGAALQAKAALTAADRARLSALSVANLDLAGMVDTWIAVAQQLQAADAQRAALVQQAREPLPDERALRREWIRLTRIIQSAAPLGGPLSDEDAALLFAKLDAESARRPRRPANDQPE